MVVCAPKHRYRNVNSHVLTRVFLGLQCLRNEPVSESFAVIESDTLIAAGWKRGHPGAALAFLLTH